jgi:hypothetical protein
VSRSPDVILLEIVEGSTDKRSEARGLVFGLLGGIATYSVIFALLALVRALV